MSQFDRFSTARSGPSGLYLFLGGLVLGLLLGWFFHGVIGFALRLLVIAAIIALAFVVFNYWRRSRTPARSPFDDIPEANWREIDSARRRNRERDPR